MMHGQTKIKFIYTSVSVYFFRGKNAFSVAVYHAVNEEVAGISNSGG